MQADIGDNASRLSGLVSHNICVLGRRTSVRLEPEVWQALRDIAARERCSIHILCSLIAKRKRAESSLTAAIRVFVTLYFRAAATDEGHRRAGHGSLKQLAETVLKTRYDRLLVKEQMISDVTESVA